MKALAQDLLKRVTDFLRHRSPLTNRIRPHIGRGCGNAKGPDAVLNWLLRNLLEEELPAAWRDPSAVIKARNAQEAANLGMLTGKDRIE